MCPNPSISTHLSLFLYFVVVQSLSRVPSLWPYWLQYARFHCPSLSPGVCSNSCPLSRWCHSTILSSVIPFSSCPQSFPTSGFFSNELALLIRWPEYWSFSFSVCSSNEYSGLISFRIDWFDLLSVQGTLKNLLQHHSLKASILWHAMVYFPCEYIKICIILFYGFRVVHWNYLIIPFNCFQ